MNFTFDGIGYFLAFVVVITMMFGYFIGNGIEYLFSHIAWKG